MRLGKLTPELQARYCLQQTQAQTQVGSENTGEYAYTDLGAKVADAKADAIQKAEVVCGKDSPLDHEQRNKLCRSFCLSGTLTPELRKQFCSANTK